MAVPMQRPALTEESLLPDQPSIVALNSHACFSKVCALLDPPMSRALGKVLILICVVRFPDLFLLLGYPGRRMIPF